MGFLAVHGFLHINGYDHYTRSEEHTSELQSPDNLVCRLLLENPELAEMMSEFDAYIGELFISIDKAHEQAEEYGHSFEREMGFLAVHGFLHINGYDHYTPEEEAEMFGLQEEILTAYGLTRQ